MGARLQDMSERELLNARDKVIGMLEDIDYDLKDNLTRRDRNNLENSKDEHLEALELIEEELEAIENENAQANRSNNRGGYGSRDTRSNNRHNNHRHSAGNASRNSYGSRDTRSGSSSYARGGVRKSEESNSRISRDSGKETVIEEITETKSSTTNKGNNMNNTDGFDVDSLYPYILSVTTREKITKGNGVYHRHIYGDSGDVTYSLREISIGEGEDIADSIPKANLNIFKTSDYEGVETYTPDEALVVKTEQVYYHSKCVSKDDSVINLHNILTDKTVTPNVKTTPETVLKKTIVPLYNNLLLLLGVDGVVLNVSDYDTVMGVLENVKSVHIRQIKNTLKSFTVTIADGVVKYHRTTYTILGLDELDSFIGAMEEEQMDTPYQSKYFQITKDSNYGIYNLLKDVSMLEEDGNSLFYIKTKNRDYEVTFINGKGLIKVL